MEQAADISRVRRRLHQEVEHMVHTGRTEDIASGLTPVFAYILQQINNKRAENKKFILNIQTVGPLDQETRRGSSVGSRPITMQPI